VLCGGFGRVKATLGLQCSEEGVHLEGFDLLRADQLSTGGRGNDGAHIHMACRGAPTLMRAAERSMAVFLGCGNLSLPSLCYSHNSHTRSQEQTTSWP